MGLADRLDEITNIVYGTKCVYQILIDNMKEEDRLALEAAWNKGTSQRIVLRALRAEGYKTSNEAILNHRTGNCKCAKKD